MTMQCTKQIEVSNKLGLHARASGKLVELTSQFDCTIEIGRSGNMVDAKNIIALMMLGAGKGAQLELRVLGDQAEHIAQQIEQLFADKFYEGE